RLPPAGGVSHLALHRPGTHTACSHDAESTSAGNSASRTGREPASHHPGGPQPTPAAPPSLPAGAHRPPRLPPPARLGRNRPAPGAAAPRTPGSSPGAPGELPHAPSIAGTSAADVEPVLPWETSPSEYSGTRPFRDGEVSLLSSLSHLLCYSKVTPSWSVCRRTVIMSPPEGTEILSPP